MKSLFVYCILLFLCIDQLAAKELMVLIQYGNNELPYYLKLKKSLSDLNIDFLTYSIDKDRTIEENSFQIDSAINSQKEKADSLKVFLMSDCESSFVALDVLSLDTSIVALITLSGAFCNGDEYFYNEISVKKHMEMLDSVSFDGKTEQYLRTAYRMISQVKQGKKLKLPKAADDNMRELFTLLNSRYGRSLLIFSLDDHLKKVRSWIVPFYSSKSQRSELDLYIGKLIYEGAKFRVKFTESDVYNDQNVGSKITEHVSKLLKH